MPTWLPSVPRANKRVKKATKRGSDQRFALRRGGWEWLEPRVLLAADLSVTAMTATPATVVPGELIDYTITVKNPGDATAHNVSFTDNLPSGVTFVSASADQGSFTVSNDNITGNLGDLAAGATDVIHVKATATTASGAVSNVANVASTDDTNLDNNSKFAIVTVNAPASTAANLFVSKTATRTGTVGTVTTALPGQELTYTLTVTNNNQTDAAQNVVLSDSLPAGLMLLNVQSNTLTTGGNTQTGGTVSQNGDSVSDSIGSLAAGDSATIKFDVLVTGTGAINNSAIATTDSGVTNPSQFNNIGSDTVTSTTAADTGVNLALSKTDDTGGNAVDLNQNVTYSITVTNNGTNAANDVEITDLLPSALNYLSSASTSGTSGSGAALGTADFENGSVIDEVGTLAAGASVTLQVHATAGSAGMVSNTACVTTTSGDTDVTDNCKTDTISVNNTSAANVSINKTGPSTGTVGQQLTYTVTITNSGASAASNVAFADTLPTGETFVSANDSGGGTVTNNAGALSETISALGAGATDTITLVVTPTQTGDITNTASVNVAGNTSNQTTSSVTTAVSAQAPQPNVSINKTGPSTGTVGQQLTYTVTITNSGASAASNVAFTDTLPAGETFVSASDSGGGTIANNAGALSETISALAAGGTDTITLVVTPTQTGDITNTASVNVAGNTSNQTTSSVTTTVSAQNQGPNVSLSKTGPSTSTVGDEISYTITATNNGNAAASNLAVSDTLPGGVTFVSANDSGGGTVNNNNGALSETIGSLAAGATDTITVIVTPTQAGTITNTAAVNVAGNASNQTSASVQTVVSAAGSGAANVSVTKTGPSTATVGQQLTYTVTIVNHGSTAASNVAFIDTLPAGETFVSANDSAGGTVANNAGALSETIASLAAGATDTITLVVTPTQARTVTNTALIAVPGGNQNGQTTSSVTTTVSAQNQGADVSIAKTGPATGTVGDQLTYTITVTNHGGSAAGNVAISDTLPAGVAFVSASDSSGGTVANNAGTLSETIASLGAGATDTVTLIVTPTQAGTITNTAAVNVSGNTSNQTSSSVQTVVSAAGNGASNVSVTKTGPSTGTVGQQLTYTVTIVNQGSAAASNVAFADNLPVGETFVSASDSAGGTVVHNGSALSETIGSLAAGATDTITIVVTPTQAGTIANTALISVPGGNQSGQTTSTVTTTVSGQSQSSNVSVTKTGPATGTVGDRLTYTITVTNHGNGGASNIALSDNLPGGVTFVSASDSAGGTVAANGSAISETIGSLAAGATDTITLVVTPTQAGTITNTASVNVSGNTSGQTSSSVQTVVSAAGSGAANVSISKTGPGSGTVGQQLTYTITITNNGSASANGVTLTDNLPAGLSNVSATDSLGGTVTVGANALSETITLGAGQTDTITVHVTPTQAGTIVNTASITTPGGNQSGQSTSTVTTTISGQGGGGGGGGGQNGLTCYLNGQAGDATNTVFITNLYRELLGRDPDQGGEQFWVNYLNGGNNGQNNNNNGNNNNNNNEGSERRHNAITAFLNAQEYKVHLVSCMFQNFLGRAPDQGGLQFFVNELGNPGQEGGPGDSGHDEELILSQIIGSQEFYAKAGGTSQGFVSAMYQDLLGRTADQGGSAYWASVVDNVNNNNNNNNNGNGNNNNGNNGNGNNNHNTGGSNVGELHSLDGVIRAFLNTSEAEHKLLNANWPQAGNPGAAGTPAGGNYGLANITGGGWENLYFQGNFPGDGQNNNAANDAFFAKLQGNTPWDDVIEDMLETQRYNDASRGY
jgi:large repetitive protein